MNIELKNSALKSLELTDAASLAKHANNPNIAMFLREGFPSPYSKEDAVTFIKHTQQTKHVHFGIAVNGQVCGIIGLIYHHTNIKDAELGFWLSDDFWGKGVITEATKAIVKYGFEVMQLNRIYSSCFTDNYGSKRVHEKVGFTFLGEASDICSNAQRNKSLTYEMLREDYLKM